MFLAFRELGQSKLRYTLVALIMIAVLFLVFFVTGLANGLGYGDSSSIRNLSADYIVMNKDADGALLKSALTQKQVDDIKQQMGHKASPIAMNISSINKGDDKAVDVAYFSIDKDNYPDLDSVEGKNISELTGNEVVVDKSINVHGDFKLGDTILDKKTGKKMTIAGFTNDQTYSMMPVVFADFNQGLNLLYDNQKSYNAVVYSGSKAKISGYDTLTKDEVVKAIPGYKETQGSLMMIVVFLFIISAFVSTVFFYVITIQKLNQFGILKAIGATTGYISRSIIIQVIMLTLTGLIFSSLLVYGMTQVIPEGMPFRTSPAIVGGTAALFLALNLLGALLSVVKAAKTDAIEAIGRVQ